MTNHEIEILKNTLANAKLEFTREMDRLVLTIQSGSYAIKVDATEEILPLVDEINNLKKNIKGDD